MSSRVLRLLFVAVALAVTPRLMHAQLAQSEPEWYLPSPDGCRLFVQEYGTGADTVVVLHGGWGAEHSYLLGAFAGLERRYHMVFYDQRGSLRSPCPDSLLSVTKQVEDLERLRLALQLNRMTVVGHSMGTFLAMEYLSQHPGRVRGMVLMGAVPPRTPTSVSDSAASSASSRAANAFFTRAAVAAALRSAGVDGDTSRLTPKQRTTRWRIAFAGVNLYHVERWPLLKGGKAYFNLAAANAMTATAPATYDLTSALLAQDCPVTVIQGDHDYLDMGALRHAAWTRGATGARLVVIADAGHASWIDAPKAVYRALSDALRRGTHCQ